MSQMLRKSKQLQKLGMDAILKANHLNPKTKDSNLVIHYHYYTLCTAMYSVKLLVVKCPTSEGSLS